MRTTAASLLLAVAAGLAPPSAIPQTTPPRVLAWEESLRGSEAVEVRWPVAVAAASPGEIAVADALGDRLVVLRRQGAEWAVAAVSLPATPVGLAHDGNRYLVSLRGTRGLMAVEGPDLRLRPVPLPAGAVPGTLAGLPAGGFLVYDLAGARVVRLAAGGAVAGAVPVAGHVTALAATADGGFVAAVPATSSLLRYGPSGSLEATWPIPGEGATPAWPQGLATEPGGDVFVADRHGGRIVVLDAGGRVVGMGSRKGWEDGLLLFPGGLARLPDGRIAVADQGNERVQLFARTGGP